MTSKTIFRTLIISTIVLINIGCDQVSKNIARNNIEYEEVIPLVGNSISLMKVENTGAFLSTGANLPDFIKLFLLQILPVIFLIYLFWMIVVKKDLGKFTVLGLAFAIGGGIGNIYDRILYGSVTDFLHIKLGVFQTGIFNLADVSVMVGVGLVLLDYVLEKRKKRTVME